MKHFLSHFLLNQTDPSHKKTGESQSWSQPCEKCQSKIKTPEASDSMKKGGSKKTLDFHMKLSLFGGL